MTPVKAIRVGVGVKKDLSQMVRLFVEPFTESSIQIPEDPCSNPGIINFYPTSIYLIKRYKNTEEDDGNYPLITLPMM